MSDRTQSASNHTRWNPLFHFIASPIAMLNLYVAVQHARHVGGRYAWWNVVFAFGVLCAVFVARTMALTVQDRLIRLEVSLRLREVLPAARHAEISKLRVKQCVALRFAGDGELASLFDRIVSGELADPKAIKNAIKDWQADWVRA